MINFIFISNHQWMIFISHDLKTMKFKKQTKIKKKKY